MLEFITGACYNPTVTMERVRGSLEHMYRNRKRSNSGLRTVFWPITDRQGHSCGRRLAAAIILPLLLAIALISAATTTPTALYAQGNVSTQASSSLGDGKA